MATPQRLPVDRLARRYLALTLLERELSDFDDARRGPEWAGLRQSIEDVIVFLNVAIEYGADDLAKRLGKIHNIEQPPQAATENLQ